jgi:hypothetical protein
MSASEDQEGFWNQRNLNQSGLLLKLIPHLLESDRFVLNLVAFLNDWLSKVDIIL